MGALVAAIAVGIILYLTVYKNKLPEFTLPSEEKVRPEQLLDEMLEKAGVYHKYMLDSEELSISLGKDRKIALGTVQNVNDQRISISYHNHQLSEEDDLIVGTYEKKMKESFLTQSKVACLKLEIKSQKCISLNITNRQMRTGSH